MLSPAAGIDVVAHAQPPNFLLAAAEQPLNIGKL